MDRNPYDDAKLLAGATERLLASVRSMDDAQVATPSTLPGWSRGHVLTHLSRHADALANLAHTAVTGEPRVMYASPEARSADIEAGAGRGHADQLADLTAATDRLAALIAAVPAARWAADVAYRQGPGPAANIPWNRLAEVEIHHVDLGLGYSPDDWDPAFGTGLLDMLAPDFAARATPATVRAADTGATYRLGDGPTVTGTSARLAAWLVGRPAAGLAVDPIGPLPVPPRWK
ncbi:MAG TPA: maleylpyruvate isomerase family mycothiol-dependent enzyme [Actinocatenispora sp.]